MRSNETKCRRSVGITLAAVLALVTGCLPFGDGAEEVTHQGVAFDLTCRIVEPDIVGGPVEISTNVRSMTASRDIITLDPHVAFAYRQQTGCGSGFDYEADWFLALSDEVEGREERRIVEQTAPFRG